MIFRFHVCFIAFALTLACPLQAAEQTPTSASSSPANSSAVPAPVSSPEILALHVLNRLGYGPKPGEMALDVLALHPATAHHLAFQLGQYFVQDNPPPALVDLGTQRYLDTWGDIRSVLGQFYLGLNERKLTILFPTLTRATPAFRLLRT
jgi:hypothetical protein